MAIGKASSFPWVISTSNTARDVTDQLTNKTLTTA